jgi:hypothetical protein
MEWIILIGLFLFGYTLTKSYSSKSKATYVDSDGVKKTEQLKPRQSRQILSIEVPENIELSDESREILNLFENTSQNVFMTGKAGTGKSTLLRYFRATTKKNHAVIAPTGIAAINVQGQTIHSFFGFGIDITTSRVRFVSADKLRVIRSLQTLIIDEISMVRADLFDCINISLQKNRRNTLPFGGVQIIAIGDPYQLPPVVKESERSYFDKVYGGHHFFHSHSFKAGNFQIRELTKVHRQKDEVFKKILNSIRTGDCTNEDIELLNSSITNNKPAADTVKLVTTNDLARTINEAELAKLVGNEKKYTAHVIDEFRERDMPTDQELILKEGEMVMLLNNDREKRWVNGSTAKIISLDEISIKVKFEDNTYAEVGLNEWDNIQFVFNENEQKIEPKIVGKFIQLPVKPAWAITIHKSQGQTYSTVHIDFGGGTFAPGQAYVALSRCTSLEGLSMEAPIVKDDIIVDGNVRMFMNHSNNEARVLKSPVDTFPKNCASISKVTKSDINKMINFMNHPSQYATGTPKARMKVQEAKQTFGMVKHTLDAKTIDQFENAVQIYLRANKN